MKCRVSMLALGLLSSFSLVSSAQPTLTAQKLAEGVWAAQPQQGANVGWFLLGDGVLVVDSGQDAETARAILEKIAETAGKPVRYLVVTHAHGDHAGGAGVFAAAGAQVICQENVAGAVANVVQSGGDAPAGKPGPGVLAISARLTFFGGPRRAEIDWLGSAHTRGDLVVLLPEDKILFAGDLVLNKKIPFMQSPDVDPKGWEQILPRLAALDLSKVVPGHGEIGPRQGIADTLAYVRKVNELARTFLQTRVPDELYALKLREPENRIENVPVIEEHISNVRAAVRAERARLEKATPTPAPTKAPEKKS